MRDLSVYGVKCECDNIQSFQALEGVLTLRIEIHFLGEITRISVCHCVDRQISKFQHKLFIFRVTAEVYCH